MSALEPYHDVDTIDAEDRGNAPVLPIAPSYPNAPGAAAYRGVLGQLVRTLEPQTEADPAAILVQAIVAFGNIVGRSTYFVADGTRHHCNLFAVIVAASSKGRKGTAWSQARTCFTSADPDWRIVSGLSSGEGLIWHVRDAGTTDQGDPGVVDKRLLVMEPEFAKVLRVVERDGSTLSAVLREAWDSGCLSTLTKNAPAAATGAHVSLIGHITAEELRRYLTATEAGNGFGNRFLWVCAKRSKYLPDGGMPDQDALAETQRELCLAIDHARRGGEVRKNPAASDLWHAVYRDLSEGRPGLLGSMTGRAEAQVMRLATVYALADAASVIELSHLEAALELWRYCFESAGFIFGDSLGDRVADDLRSALVEAGAAGISRAEMSRDVFGRNRSTHEIRRALGMLQGLALARCVVNRAGVGRPVERWYAVH